MPPFFISEINLYSRAEYDYEHNRHIDQHPDHCGKSGTGE